ncbi:hypothetical protein ACFVH6_30405 [Spirillospora sp. NPDC127200]
MIDPVLGGAVLFIALTAGTKTGRAAARNAAASGYKATGWKPPKTAIVHYSGKAGEALGKRFAATTRKTRRATMRMVEKRWSARVNSDTPPGSQPPVKRVTPPRPSDTPPQADGEQPPSRRPAGHRSGPSDQVRYGPFTNTVVHDDDTYTLKPSKDGGHSPQSDHGTGAGPAAVPSAGPESTRPVHGAARSTMSTFSLDLERPTTDAEFLETCIVLGDVLRGLSKSVEEWAGDVAGLGLPGQVTAPLEAVAEGIGDAATAVTRSATAFADIFEEPREIASRGMKFTGEEAA